MAPGANLVGTARVVVAVASLCGWAGRAAGQEASAAADVLPLAGRWRFQLDRDDAGVAGRWFERALPDTVVLPGSLPAQGIGDEVTVDTRWTGGIVDRSWFTEPEYEVYRRPGQVKVPFWLQPERYYVGPAWYQRDLELPATWRGRRVVLSLERPHGETRVWLDDTAVGRQNGLATPHDYDLGQPAPGRHRLTVRLDNRLTVDVGQDSHSVSDHTQGNWNGIVGRLELRATPPVWVDDLQVFPRLATGSLTVKGRLGNAGGQPGSGRLAFDWLPSGGPRSPAPRHAVPVTWDAQGGTFEADLPAGPEPPQPWSEFTPALYEVHTWLDGAPALPPVTVGLREVGTQGTQFTLNGQPVFFRGTLECCIFPKTGHPPTDVASWTRLIGTAKAHGLNMIRFHSWCPPTAAFAAADRLGFYLQVECSSWANSSTGLGQGKPIDAWIYEEADRILRHYGNHPSFVLLLYGNEPGGDHVPFLTRWVEHYRAQDPRHLVSSAAGWPQLAVNQFHVAPDPRLQGWGAGLSSRINARPPETQTDYRDYTAARRVPVISHEIGQWCVYPNLDEIPKYTGYLKPRNFEIFRDALARHGLLGQAGAFLLASGKLQTLCYKEEIESALRTPGMGGFQLLDLHDFPGQGTALVGVLDPFWESKGYVSAAEYSRFCNSTVPLARLRQRVFTTDATLEADLEAAHFGPAPLENAVTAWRLVDDAGRAVASGTLPPRTVPLASATPLGHIAVPLATVPAPARYRLVVSLAPGLQLAADGAVTAPAPVPTTAGPTRPENDWDVWVYPPRVDIQPPAGVALATDLDAQALATLRAGGKLLLLVPPRRVRNAARDKVVLGFSSIFWNTAWTRRQPPTALGILCDPRHPALAAFPTDSHSNWQWWYLVTRAGALLLDDLPPALQPTVRVIDDWFTARRLGLVIEGRVGAGALLVCSIDLRQDLEANPVARQLLHSLLAYMAGDRFRPTVDLTPDQVRSLFTTPTWIQRLEARVRHTDSAQPGYEGGNVLDGDPQTLWHTAWTPNLPGFPHEIQIEFPQPVALRAVTLLPRQDRNPNGMIRDAVVYVSDDGQAWGDPVASGSFAADDGLKTLPLATPPRRARFLRLIATRGQTDGPWTSLAELDVIPADPERP